MDILKKTIIHAIEELKGEHLIILDITELSSIADELIIITGRSNRHVKAIADNIALLTKHKGLPVLRHEGLNTMEWVVLDYGDIIVHIMQQSIREFYDLESLWSLKS